MSALLTWGLIAFAGTAAAAGGWSTIPDSDAPPQFCGSFDVTSNYTKEAGDPVRVSAGIVCGPGHTPISNCSIHAGGFWEAYPMYNSSVATQNMRAIDWTIYRATGDSKFYFSHPAYGAMPNTTYNLANEPVRNGTVAGFVQFTNQYRCVSGVLGDCPAQFALTNGTYIEACAAAFLDVPVPDDTDLLFAGTAGLNRTNATYAATLTNNPISQKPLGIFPGAASSLGSSVSAMLATMGALSVAIVIMA